MDSSSPYCPTCGALNAADAETCFACGKALPLAEPEAIGEKARTRSGQLLPQQMLKLRFRILKRIGEGGFGAVYQGEDTESGNRLVAIKEMSHEGLSPDDLQEATDAFHREAQFLMELAHPGLPQIYGHFSEGGNWYLVMDFIKGETLESYVARQGGHLPLKEVLDLGIKLCDVLEYLHLRQPPVIFRDLKPDNVMLTPNHRVYLIDFGIARHFTPGKLHDTIAFGSPGYAAPEQYGKAQTTPRSDIFSLGALLHHLLTGDDPAKATFHFAPLHMRRPVGLSELIAQMVELDQEKRPASMRAVRDELKRLAGIWEADQQRLATTAVANATSASASPRFSPPITPIPVRAPASPTPVSSSQSSPAKALFGLGWLVFVIICAVVLALSSKHSSPPVYTYPYDTPIYDTPVYTPVPYINQINAAAWSPDGKHLAAASSNGYVSLWDATTGTLQFSRPLYNGGVTWLAWSPDGTRIAAAGYVGPVEVLDATSGNRISSYFGHNERASELSWSPDGKQIASSSDDGTVQVWDLGDSQPGRTVLKAPGQVWTVGWSPDGTYLAAAGQDNLVHVINAATGQEVYTYRGHTAGVSHIAWSPDGKQIASASLDGTVQVWDALTGSHAFTYRGHSGHVGVVAWSPDGTYLASGGEDGTVQVWNPGSAAPSYIYHGQVGAAIYDVAWSPDGKRIVSASSSGIIEAWDAFTGLNVLSYSGQS